MNTIGTISLLGAGVYALRFAGLALRDVAVPPAWEGALGFVPVALLTALIVSSIAGRPDDGGPRLIAAAGAALIARRSGRLWACILGGMAVYWLLRLAWG